LADSQQFQMLKIEKLKMARKSQPCWPFYLKKTIIMSIAVSTDQKSARNPFMSHTFAIVFLKQTEIACIREESL